MSRTITSKIRIELKGLRKPIEKRASKIVSPQAIMKLYGKYFKNKLIKNVRKNKRGIKKDKIWKMEASFQEFGGVTKYTTRAKIEPNTKAGKNLFKNDTSVILH